LRRNNFLRPPTPKEYLELVVEVEVEEIIFNLLKAGLVNFQNM
jgi:hypothetical protein